MYLSILQFIQTSLCLEKLINSTCQKHAHLTNNLTSQSNLPTTHIKQYQSKITYTNKGLFTLYSITRTQTTLYSSNISLYLFRVSPRGKNHFPIAFTKHKFIQCLQVTSYSPNMEYNYRLPNSVQCSVIKSDNCSII